MKPRTLITLITTIAALAIPASAQAITVTGVAGEPTDLQAGANSDFNIGMTFAAGQVKDLTVGLPPGVVGDPTATPKCTVAQLNASTAAVDGCPANTVVGEVHADAAVLGFLPVTADGLLFNLVPQAGEPARFGIVLRPLGGGLPVVPPIILQSGAALRNTDYGLDTIINNIPNTTLAMGDTTITGQDITLYGSRPWMSKPFMRNPTSCTPKVVTFRANDYADPNTFATGQAPPFTPTNCGALPFSPTFSAKVKVPGEFTNGQKPSLTTVIEQDVGESGLRDAKVTVPSDFAPDTAQLALGEICPPANFQAGTCPANTIVGSALATSPLLTSPLTGPVIAVDSGTGLPFVGLDLSGELTFRLTGQLAFDNSTTFTGLPDIPIAHFELSFTGGPDGLLISSRDVCQPPAPAFATSFTSFGDVTLLGSTPATIEGCVPSKKKCPPAKKKKGKKKSKGAAAAAKKKKGKKKRKGCVKKKKKKKKKKRK